MMPAVFQRVLNSTRLPICAAGWDKAQSQGLLEKWGCNERAKYMLCLSNVTCTGCMGPGFHMWLALLQLFLLRNWRVILFLYVFPICSLNRLHPAQPPVTSHGSKVSLRGTGKHCWDLEPQVLWISGAQVPAGWCSPQGSGLWSRGLGHDSCSAEEEGWSGQSVLPWRCPWRKM